MKPARLARFVVMSAGICAALWLAGLVLFANHVRNLDAAAENQLAPTDAIVVLTGGSERLRTGLDLLKAGHGKKLFISGVHPHLTLDHVLGNTPLAPDLRACCIVLGHAAESTEGNAIETQNWMAFENYHSLRLVTANYHMPRSLLLFHAVMPEMVIIPHPVAPESVHLDDWWLHVGTASLLATEYNKYLVARFSMMTGML